MTVMVAIGSFGFGAFVGLICGYIEMAAEFKKRRR